MTPASDKGLGRNRSAEDVLDRSFAAMRTGGTGTVMLRCSVINRGTAAVSQKRFAKKKTQNLKSLI